ncbi:MAG: hypothetical protein M1814_003148 [Vezdaea aestivalis]|nr:MAG: hypothetical protein M1814_003148 [Vezdaea aestivalis]
MFPPLQARDDGCFDKSATHCAGFPSEFCCPSGYSCLPIDDGSSLICCGAGSDCSSFQSIPCDVSQQNVTKFPGTLVITQKPNLKLPVCGDKCCPAGYECENGNACINKNPRPSSTPTASSASSSRPSSSSTSIPSVQSTPASTTETPEPAPSNPLPPKAILIGLFPGLAAGILLTLLAVILLGRRRRRTQTSISSPILQNTNCRTDFLRLSPATPPPPPQSEKRLSRVRSLFRRDTHKSYRSQRSRATTMQSRTSSAGSGEEISIFAPNLTGHSPPTAGPGSHLHAPPVPTLPTTPESGVLNIYSAYNTPSSKAETPVSIPAALRPGGLAMQQQHDTRASTMTHKTTFTDLMEDAGRSREGRYVGVPAAGGTPPVPPVPTLARGVGGSIASQQRR